MKNILAGFVLAAATLAAPALSFAQSNAQVTRAEVRADLVRLENAGYNPGQDDSTYPAQIQAAEAKVAAQSDQQQQSTQGYGGVAENGSASSGARLHAAMHPVCVGPVSFCNIYSGS